MRYSELGMKRAGRIGKDTWELQCQKGKAKCSKMDWGIGIGGKVELAMSASRRC